MYGSDQAASIETHALANFVETVRAVPAILGTGQKILGKAEMQTREKLRIAVEG
jgi:sialic acid synthase SpsE